jgi:hypothetical protein
MVSSQQMPSASVVVLLCKGILVDFIVDKNFMAKSLLSAIFPSHIVTKRACLQISSQERHRHRLEYTNALVNVFEQANLVILF